MFSSSTESRQPGTVAHFLSLGGEAGREGAELVRFPPPLRYIESCFNHFERLVLSEGSGHSLTNHRHFRALGAGPLQLLIKLPSLRSR